MQALQERLAQQISQPQPAVSLDLARLWQSVLGLGNLPTTTQQSTPFTSALDLSALPGSSSHFGSLQALLPTHPLFQSIGSPSGSGICAWPQCAQNCENFTAFLLHLAQTHVVDEKSTQQCKMQIELVESLEIRLAKERSRLQAMMSHLQLKVRENKIQFFIRTHL